MSHIPSLERPLLEPLGSLKPKVLPKEEVLSYKTGEKDCESGEGNEALRPQVHRKSIMSLTKTHAK